MTSCVCTHFHILFRIFSNNVPNNIERKVSLSYSSSRPRVVSRKLPDVSRFTFFPLYFLRFPPSGSWFGGARVLVLAFFWKYIYSFGSPNKIITIYKKETFGDAFAHNFDASKLRCRCLPTIKMCFCPLQSSPRLFENSREFLVLAHAMRKYST